MSGRTDLYDVAVICAATWKKGRRIQRGLWRATEPMLLRSAELPRLATITTPDGRQTTYWHAGETILRPIHLSEPTQAPCGTSDSAQEILLGHGAGPDHPALDPLGHWSRRADLAKPIPPVPDGTWSLLEGGLDKALARARESVASLILTPAGLLRPVPEPRIQVATGPFRLGPVTLTVVEAADDNNPWAAFFRLDDLSGAQALAERWSLAMRRSPPPPPQIVLTETSPLRFNAQSHLAAVLRTALGRLQTPRSDTDIDAEIWAAIDRLLALQDAGALLAGLHELLQIDADDSLVFRELRHIVAGPRLAGWSEADDAALAP